MSYQQKSVEKSVFRAYDIRGIIGSQLDEDAFYSIGLALSCLLLENNRAQIFVARDGRLSSEYLLNALKAGLLESGIDVFDLGTIATPVLYYATHTQKVDSGIIVTGSHNPADYNGIKIVLAGNTLVKADIENIYHRIQSKQRTIGEGQYSEFNILAHYIARITNAIKLNRKLKVVVDCGNGIAGPVIPNLLTTLGCDVISLYCDVDGNFPNHHPDPSIEENLIDLKSKVLEENADIGIAFDGDADRLGVVTNLGEIIWPDRLLMLYAKNVLKDNPGATIVFDVKCSSHLAEFIKKEGGIPCMCPTGHSLVKSVMKQENAALAGEMSGHLFFKDKWYGFDDALYSACRLLELLSQEPLTIHEQFLKIPNSVNTPEIKIPIPEEEKFLFMERFSQEAKFPDARIISIDGLRVEFSYGWGLVRASNTTPCLVARFEAKDNCCLEKIKTLFKCELQNINKNLVISF